MMVVRVGISAGDFVGDTGAPIQQAIDAVACCSGGTVEVGPGAYTLYNSVLLRSNVRLVGAGSETILRKWGGASSGFLVDADWEQHKVTVEDPAGFRPGLGVVVEDGRSGSLATLATVVVVQGNVVYLDRALKTDCDADFQGRISTSFPLVAGFGVDSVVVEGFALEGSKETTTALDGGIGAGGYFKRVRHGRFSDCVVRDFAGDGFGAQTSQDVILERCEAHGCTHLGFHPGAGCARPVFRNCRACGNGEDGFFLCWRVQEGRFEGNEATGNGRFGISIGHKDTDNLFEGNTVRGNKAHGIVFRHEKPSNAGSRNTLRDNVIEDNTGAGIDVRGFTTDLLFEGNVIRDTRMGEARTQRVGICAGEHTARLRAVRNRLENHPEGAVQGAIALE